MFSVAHGEFSKNLNYLLNHDLCCATTSFFLALGVGLSEVLGGLATSASIPTLQLCMTETVFLVSEAHQKVLSHNLHVNKER